MIPNNFSCKDLGGLYNRAENISLHGLTNLDFLSNQGKPHWIDVENTIFLGLYKPLAHSIQNEPSRRLRSLYIQEG